jgi:hypothetical protein
VAGTEVYLAHHHDKVVVSVPDGREREELVQRLARESWLFTDVSGYGSTMDGEDDAEDEDTSDCG